MSKLILIVLIFIITAFPSVAALRAVYAGTDSEEGISEALRRGVELVMADALQDEGLALFDIEEIQRLARAQVYRSDITGEKNLSFWCRKIKAERGIFAYIKRKDSIYELTLFVVHPAKERVEFAARVDFSDAESADESAKKAAARVSKYLAESANPNPGPTVTGFCVRSVVPGLAQKYYGHEIRGTLLQSLFAAGLITSGLSYGYYRYRVNKYERYEGGPDYPGDTEYKEKAAKKYSEMKNSFKYMRISCISTCAIWVYNFIDAYAFSFTPVDFKYERRPWRATGVNLGTEMTVSPVIIEDENSGQPLPGVGVTIAF